jgi:hypothetical protein
MLPLPALPPSRRLLRTGVRCGAAALLLAASHASASAISGVCPDGSIFIVQQVEAIPCRDAKRVDPGDIPPLKPEFLPRPYGWEVFNRETNPNNPYNLIDVGRGGAPAPGVGAPPQAAGAPPAPQASLAPAPIAPAPPAVAPAVAAAPPGAAALALSLSPREVEDLAAIVEVMQERAPATFVQRDDAGRAAQLRLARSAAFEARVARALAERGTPAPGPVVVFHLVADAPTSFWGNLTFVQGHVAHHPDPADPAQFGVVDGRLGELAAGERVLGYVVLSAGADTARPLDVYWDDRLLTATLTP